MRAFLAKRFVMGIFAILGATVIVFVLSRVGGQDPRYFYLGNSPGYAVTQEQWDAWGEKLGLNKPVIVQYFLWVGGVLRGDLGNSTQSGRTVLSLIGERAPATGQLALGGWIFGILVGFPLGVFSAVRRGGVLDYLARGFALIGQATPTFWLSIMAILVFSVYLGWLPSGTRGDGFSIRHLILPWIMLGINPAAAYLRFTRSSMLEVLDSGVHQACSGKGHRKPKDHLETRPQKRVTGASNGFSTCSGWLHHRHCGHGDGIFLAGCWKGWRSTQSGTPTSLYSPAWCLCSLLGT